MINRGFIDLKPYYGKETEVTEDALGFGKTLVEASNNAMARQAEMRAKKRGGSLS